MPNGAPMGCRPLFAVGLDRLVRRQRRVVVVSLSMVHGYDDNENCFLVERGESSVSRFVRVSGKAGGIFAEREWRVGVDEIDTVANLESLLRQVAALDAANDACATERIRKLSIERLKEVVVLLPGQIRQIEFDPCFFGQR
jgi:hypothetical protein